MRPAIGRMRHRLALRQLTRVRDEGGGTARTDTNGPTVWARVTTASADERAAYGQLQQRVTHTAVIRAHHVVKQGQTVVWMRPGAPEPTPGTTATPEGVALYVLTAIDADPDGRPGEFTKLACEQRSTI